MVNVEIDDGDPVEAMIKAGCPGRHRHAAQGPAGDLLAQGIQQLLRRLRARHLGEALGVHRGIDEDKDERMLILLEQNYEYDPDPRGDRGVVRSIQEVEARTVRDVTDFLVRAKAGEIE